jgi:hypothetical protein
MTTGERLRADGFEAVYVELDRYNGPLTGVADVGGRPHYFQARWTLPGSDAPEGEFLVWPIDPAMFALEQESWGIFVRWNAGYEAGETTVESHPGVGGIDPRYDELQSLLKPGREVPPDARVLRGETEFLIGAGVERYRPEGCDYAIRWRSSD